MSALIAAGAGLLIGIRIALNLRQEHATSSKERQEISNRNSISEESVAAWLHGKEGDAARQRSTGTSLDSHHNEHRYLACDELDLELLIASSGSAMVLLRSPDGTEAAQPYFSHNSQCLLEGVRFASGEVIRQSKSPKLRLMQPCV